MVFSGVLYLCQIKHPEIRVHIHGRLVMATLAIQLGSLRELALICPDISKEDVVIHFTLVPSIL